MNNHQEMSEAAVIFKDLPATFPEKDTYKNPSVVGSLLFHILLIVTVLLIPLFWTEGISDREFLITLVAPTGPPPPPAPPPAQAPPVTTRQVKLQVQPVTPSVFVTPVAIPREVVKIVD